MAKPDLHSIGALKEIAPFQWLISRQDHPNMKVDGLVFADEQLVQAAMQDKALEQVHHVACLPGIVGRALAMPDIHWGYGFPIGGVAAFDVETGIVSPGGVGYDINCGVRLIRSDLREEDLRPRLEALVKALYQAVPSGVGSKGRINLKPSMMNQVLHRGAAWAVEQGFGTDEDLAHTESQGVIANADDDLVSTRAKERGAQQLGTLGSGNHFLEIQKVDELFDSEVARGLGLEKGQICILIHCGSRGLGYQVCDDFLPLFIQSARYYGIELPDRQLACAPVKSREGQDYLAAMAAAANYAWANRQCITHWVRESFEKVFQKSWGALGLRLVYDVAHNIAKIENHQVGGQILPVCVHRKGATRSFPADHSDVPADYRHLGQPVLIPGSMGTASYVAVGAPQAMTLSFGSTAHGAGRVLSRQGALKKFKHQTLLPALAAKGIEVMAHNRKTLVEEAPGAYKEIDRVVEVAHRLGLSKKAARLVPMGVIKG